MSYHHEIQKDADWEIYTISVLLGAKLHIIMYLENHLFNNLLTYLHSTLIPKVKNEHFYINPKHNKYYRCSKFKIKS